MRADRLLSIMMLLQTHGKMTTHRLAEQLEVSERTIASCLVCEDDSGKAAGERMD